MDSELIIRNIVAVGEIDINNIDRHFFFSNELFKEGEFLEGTVFLPQLIQIVTASRHIQITQAQMIFSAPDPNHDSHEISKFAKTVLSLSLGSKIIALGINFHWALRFDESHQIITKKFFFNSNNIIEEKFFVDGDPSFGFYASKNILGSRLKLDVKPKQYNTMIPPIEEFEAIGVDFNFHIDLDKLNPIQDLNKHLDKYQDFYNLTSEITSTLK
ncbi:hypothetical protein BH09BAC5_BH09BAC5_08440 [soil metagenome]